MHLSKFILTKKSAYLPTMSLILTPNNVLLCIEDCLLAFIVKIAFIGMRPWFLHVLIPIANTNISSR